MEAVALEVFTMSDQEKRDRYIGSNTRSLHLFPSLQKPTEVIDIAIIYGKIVSMVSTRLNRFHEPRLELPSHCQMQDKIGDTLPNWNLVSEINNI